MNIGSMEHVLRGESDADTFARAANVGLAGVEIGLTVAQLRDPASRPMSRLRDLAEAAGVLIPSCGLGDHNSGGLAAWWRGPDAEEEVRLAIDACRTLGADTLLLPFFFFNEPKGRSHRRALAERLKPVCDHAAASGVVLAYEGTLPATLLRELADTIKSPAFGVYYDPANATWCDHDVPADIRLLGPLLRRTHIKEANTFTGDAPPGEGRVDWTGFADALNDIDYRGWLILETPPGPPESVARDFAFARRLAARIKGEA